MKRNTKLFSVLLCLIMAMSVTMLSACDKPQEQPVQKVVRVSTTTSVNDSGLMNFLAPYFTQDTGYSWEISSAGTGAAINSAKYGNADVILVHSKASEEAFVNEGFGLKVDGYNSERISFMYNFFVLVGPSNSTNISSATSVKDAFNTIYTEKLPFVSRGDKSGTHNAEIKLWPKAMTDLWPNQIITNDASAIPTSIIYGDGNTDGFYISAGQGMGACLTMANEKNAFVLTDKATFLSYKNNAEGDKLPNLDILFEQDDAMKNTYSMIAVDPNAKFISSTDNSELASGTVSIDTAASKVFIDWMTSDHAKALMAFYGNTQYGESLFYLLDGYKAA